MNTLRDPSLPLISFFQKLLSQRWTPQSRSLDTRVNCVPQRPGPKVFCRNLGIICYNMNAFLSLWEKKRETEWNGGWELGLVFACLSRNTIALQNKDEPFHPNIIFLKWWQRQTALWSIHYDWMITNTRCIEILFFSLFLMSLISRNRNKGINNGTAFSELTEKWRINLWRNGTSLQLVENWEGLMNAQKKHGNLTSSRTLQSLRKIVTKTEREGFSL